ncbi:hypothetical protein NHP21005_01350 [Helicobacter sp. NHP21005]|uniref:hypothetical protein n=1 Tax=Helicobacter felistomachi TaxID=3040201 RepID=UPI0025742047|nr:hypothetical protein [Helicobacter sp. NHP21005]BEG56447.1 hypothetical protein NHP21005_01350 [Helicobacter sp. NHP21005]
MPFVAEVFTPTAPIKAAKFVALSLACSLKQAQSYIDRGRLTTLQGQRLKKAQILNEPVRLLFFKPTQNPEFAPIFTTPILPFTTSPKTFTATLKTTPRIACMKAFTPTTPTPA